MLYYLPIAVIVVSNIFYHICSKSTPVTVDPFASLVVTYLVGAAVSLVLYLLLSHGGNLLADCKNLNWTSYVLGIAIVGLEAGSLYMYKVGWDISKGELVYSVILAICLIVVGVLLYKETLSPSKLLGIGICLVGLFFINR